MLARLSRLFRRPASAPLWVEPAELHRRLAGEGAPIVVDVRGPDEFDGPLGHIEGARNIPLAELPGYNCAAEGVQSQAAEASSARPMNSRCGAPR